MKTFLDWAKENNERVIEIANEKPVETPETVDTTDENAKRTGLSQNYPDGYKRHQYPHKYFNPIKASTDFDFEAKPRTN